jgi:predicted nucleotidyltransferase
MNIHFTDRKLFDKLVKSSLGRFEVGSHMYGTNNENSDIDYLYIYATSENEMNSFLNTHHQLQFKEEGVDHNFVSLHTFLTNTISGDSTINFEVLNFGYFKGTLLECLYEERNSFHTYNVIRSYLGMARRDIKAYLKLTNDQAKKKKLGHIIRGGMYAKAILEHRFDIHSINREFRKINIDVSNDGLYIKSEIHINELRKSLNDKLNDRTLELAKSMCVESSRGLDVMLSRIMSSEEFKEKSDILKDFDMTVYYNAFENWVEY